MPTVESAEVVLRYEISGPRRGDVLLLSNSLGSNLHMWDKVLPALEREFRVLRYDTRGHGKSSVPAVPYTLEELGRDGLLLLDSLEIESANFCGLSLGGMVGVWLGVHAPRRVRRMILANTAARIGTLEMWDQRVATVQSSGMTTLAETTLSRWFTPAYRESHPSEMDFVRNMVASTAQDGYLGCCRVLRDSDLRRDIASIDVPCLVIAGKEDPATPPAAGRALHAGLRHSRYVELDASHLSAWEQADEFAKEVLSFFETGERCRG